MKSVVGRIVDAASSIKEVAIVLLRKVSHLLLCDLLQCAALSLDDVAVLLDDLCLYRIENW